MPITTDNTQVILNLQAEVESLRANLALQNERIKDYEAEIQHYRAMLSTR